VDITFSAQTLVYQEDHDIVNNAQEIELKNGATDRSIKQRRKNEAKAKPAKLCELSKVWEGNVQGTRPKWTLVLRVMPI
jgi:DNA-binding protein H-NS